MNTKELKETFDLVLSGTSIIKESISKQTSEFFIDFQIPSDLIEFLSNFSYNQHFKVRDVYFNRLNQIAEENLEDENRLCIDNRLLIIGCGLNGDPIIVNLQTNKVGFVFHDELWENEKPNLDEITINMNLSISAFYSKSLKEENFPVDAYQAEEYLKKTKPNNGEHS